MNRMVLRSIRRATVIVANTGANRIDKLAPDGRALAVWSAPGRAAGVSPAGAAPGASGFRRPLGVAVGAKDTIYVADSGNARVVELDRRGRLVRRWGGRGNAPGRFVDPDGIAIDAAGHVFVADGVLDRIQEFTAQGKLLAVWGKQGAGAGELSEPAAMTTRLPRRPAGGRHGEQPRSSLPARRGPRWLHSLTRPSG